MGFFRKTGNFLTFGALDKKNAKRISHHAKSLEEEAREELEGQKELTQNSLQSLGELKTETYANIISETVNHLSRIFEIDKTPLKKHNSLINNKKFLIELADMKDVSIAAKEVIGVAGAGTLGGAVAAYGTVGIIGIAGTASTGTAIGTLTGVASTNATLAWLGGGTVASGGAGVAGGMVVLGGIAVAPIALFTMFIGSQKAKKGLNEAREYADQVDVIVERIKTLISELSQIRRGSILFEETIKSLNFVLLLQNKKIKLIVSYYDNQLSKTSFFRKYFINSVKKIFRIPIYHLTDKEMEISTDTINCVKLLKDIIDTPLLNENGAFLSEAIESISALKPNITLALSNVKK